MADLNTIIAALSEIDDGVQVTHRVIEMHEPERLVDVFYIRKGRQAETLSIDASEWPEHEVWRLRDEGVDRWFRNAADDVRERKGLMPKALVEGSKINDHG